MVLHFDVIAFSSHRSIVDMHFGNTDTEKISLPQTL